MDHHGRYSGGILHGPRSLQLLREPGGNRGGDGSYGCTPLEKHPQRQRRHHPAPGPHRRNHHRGQPSSRRGGRPFVRDLGEDRGHQLPGRIHGPQGRTAGQGQRQTPAGPAVTLRSPAQTRRRPRLPSECPAGKGCRQPGGLRTGPHRTGHAQCRY